MLTFIKKRLELKIILSLAFVIVCMISVYTYFDIQHMRSDTIRTSQRTLGAFAAAIKGSVSASMKSGHHDDVKHITGAERIPWTERSAAHYNQHLGSQPTSPDRQTTLSERRTGPCIRQKMPAGTE